MRVFVLLFLSSLISLPVLAEEVITSGNGVTTELWEGKALTARFRVGVCYNKKGKANGVLLLKHRNGQEDTYHLVGTVRNNEFYLTHSSGHKLSGFITGRSTMEGKAKLANGLGLSLKGKRALNARLAAPDCAPLPETAQH